MVEREWAESEMHVMSSLEGLSKDVRCLTREVSGLRGDLGLTNYKLKMFSMLWGGIGWVVAQTIMVVFTRGS